MDRAYVLHSYPYRETSLILQAWTEKHGRMGLVAKGAKRPKSAARSLLVPFQPLVIDWFGKGELRTLKNAEPAAPATPLSGQALLSPVLHGREDVGPAQQVEIRIGMVRLDAVRDVLEADLHETIPRVNAVKRKYNRG